MWPELDSKKVVPFSWNGMRANFSIPNASGSDLNYAFFLRPCNYSQWSIMSPIPSNVAQLLHDHRKQPLDMLLYLLFYALPKFTHVITCCDSAQFLSLVLSLMLYRIILHWIVVTGMVTCCDRDTGTLPTWSEVCQCPRQSIHFHPLPLLGWIKLSESKYNFADFILRECFSVLCAFIPSTRTRLCGLCYSSTTEDSHNTSCQTLCKNFNSLPKSQQMKHLPFEFKRMAQC